MGFVVGLFWLVVVGQPAAGPKEPTRWLGAFKPAPAAHRLCRGSVLGKSEGKDVEILFTLYGTPRTPAATARFYAAAHGVKLEPPGETITVRADHGRKVLTAQPAADTHPNCGVKPAPGDRTVIIVSEKVR